MSVIGVGTDLVDIGRIEAMLARRGERLARRLLSDIEFQRFSAHSRQANYLAKCFAAKEAVAKALGTGFSEGVTWRDISLDRLPSGQPLAILSGGAAEKMHALGACSIHISLSDEQSLVSAFAVLSR